VSAYWTVALQGRAHVIRTLPDACVDLTIDLHDPRRPHAYVAGPQRKARTRRLRGRVHLLGARLLPGSSLLLGVPADALHEDWTPLGRFLKPVEVRRLEAAVGRAPSLPARIGALEAFLVDKLLNRAVDPRLSRALAAIYQAQGDLPVSDLARAAHASPRTLVRLFERWVGLAPKRFARVVRFQTALRTLDATASGADLAADLGYFDQAHLIRDIKEMFGSTPTQARRLAGKTR
jgi:AraC-like DNA-binding protein